MTKERPILFSGPMVRAIREGRKTMTRRICPESWLRCLDPDNEDERRAAQDACPYGVPGDRLWVRETWGLFDTQPSDGPKRATVFYRATDGDRHDLRHQLWRPSIHMPRWASRITLEITNVRVERLQSISAADILAEGVVLRSHNDPNLGKCPISAFDEKCYVDLQSLWKAGWDSINSKRAPWSSNPWVWVIEFKDVSSNG